MRAQGAVEVCAVTPAAGTLDAQLRALVADALREELPGVLREVLPDLLRGTLAAERQKGIRCAAPVVVLTVRAAQHRAHDRN